MRRSIVINGQEITYELTRKRVRNMNLRIRHDGTIAVSANKSVPQNVIDKFLIEKGDFILKGLSKTYDRISNAARPSTYSDGEEVNVFGEKCVIRIMQGKRAKVEYEYPIVTLIVKDPESQEERQRTYDRWKKKMLRDKVLEMCEYYYPRFEERGVEPPKDIKFRTMSSKWGCCRPTLGILTFNNNLFEVPEECTAYVVVHEFAHFLHADHSARFYREVERVMPDYRPRRKLLNEY